MRNAIRTFLLSTLVAFSLNCGGCDDPGGAANNEDDSASNSGLFTDPNGGQCAEATPCGDCDQDCRPAGNPFAPGATGGDSGFDGDPCSADSDCKGTCGGSGVCEGFGSGGFHGQSCSADSDCRGVCDGTNTCESFGVGTGYDGDRCLTDMDCRGTCEGGTCEGGGSASGGGIDGGGSGGGGTENNGSGGVGDGGDGTDQTVCLDLLIDLEHAIPTVALLIDQSGSMDAGFGNGMNRLEAAYNVLMDPDDGLVVELQNAFRIGLSLYSSYANGSDTCPDLADVRPELNNYDPIDRVFRMAEPQADTPTGESILGTLRMFDIHPDQGRKLILLATDGEPDTCAVPNPQEGQPEAIAAAQQAYQEGVETYVLSVGDDVGRPHLEDMANAGVGLPIGGAQQAPYYEANDPDQLKNEIRGIITNARSCIFRVNGGVVDPGLLDRATITLDGAVLQYGDPDGWDYHQDRQRCEGAKQCVELVGAACETIQDGDDHTVSGEFLCVYYDPENPPIDGNGSGGGGGGGNNDGSGGGGGGPGPCINPGGDCEYDGDCCSGLCGNGTCITL